MRVSASGSGVSSSAIGIAEGGHRLVVDPTSETASAFRLSNRGLPITNLAVVPDSEARPSRLQTGASRRPRSVTCKARSLPTPGDAWFSHVTPAPHGLFVVSDVSVSKSSVSAVSVSAKPVAVAPSTRQSALMSEVAITAVGDVAVSKSSSSFAVAVRDLDPSQRAPLASAGPSAARTQGGPRSIAAWSDRGRSSAKCARRRQRCALARGEGSPFPPAMTASGRGLLPPHNHQLYKARFLSSRHKARLLCSRSPQLLRLSLPRTNDHRRSCSVAAASRALITPGSLALDLTNASAFAPGKCVGFARCGRRTRFRLLARSASWRQSSLAISLSRCRLAARPGALGALSMTGDLASALPRPGALGVSESPPAAVTATAKGLISFSGAPA